MHKDEFQHSIAKFILRNFVDRQGLWICKKNTGVEHKSYSINKPSNPVLFGKINFYGHKKIIDITNEKNIASNSNDSVETFLGKDIEHKIAPIFKKIIYTPNLKLNDYEIEQIRKYVFIQHTRTPKFKKDMELFYQSDIYKEIEESVKNKYGKQFQNTIFNALNKKFLSDNHTLFIVDDKIFKDFYNITEMNKTNLYVLVRTAPNYFVLPDSGVMCVELIETERIWYLPISPIICLCLSKLPENKLPKYSQNDFNELVWLEAMEEIYSNSKNKLEEIYNKFKNKKEIFSFLDGTKKFE
jgi:S-adenosylmethionine hydrolase